MSETYACSYQNCDRVFTRAYELKKHKAIHENPDSVFRCQHPGCEFYTLQKKNLAIHVSIHTGEKNCECPDMIDVNGVQQRCDYRTNDPAALSKHRKKIHGHVPPPNRCRQKAAPPTPLESQQNQDKKPLRRSGRTQPTNTVSPRKARRSRSPRKPKNPKDGSANPSTAPFVPSPLRNVAQDAMDVDDDFDYDPSAVTLVGTDDEMGLDTLFDPSLRAGWMAKYEMSYTDFDLAGTRNKLEALAEVSEFDPGVVDERTGREGCLCPEWMVETRVEGWDESVLETHKEYYMMHV